LESRVKLEIFNAIGQRVATLVDGERSAGNYEAEWKSAVTSGIYFYRLEAVASNDPNKRFLETKKMLLLR
jgi:flagellar hook assembly protein FlgD